MNTRSFFFAQIIVRRIVYKYQRKRILFFYFNQLSGRFCNFCRQTSKRHFDLQFRHFCWRFNEVLLINCFVANV